MHNPPVVAAVNHFPGPVSAADSVHPAATRATMATDEEMMIADAVTMTSADEVMIAVATANVADRPVDVVQPAARHQPANRNAVTHRAVHRKVIAAVIKVRLTGQPHFPTGCSTASTPTTTAN